MDTSLVQLSSQSLMFVPIVMALVALVKMYLDAYWAPLFALGFGIALAFFFPSTTAGFTLLNGMIIGLTAAGLYSGGAKLING